MRVSADSPLAGSFNALPTITADEFKSLPNATDTSSANWLAFSNVLPVTLPNVNSTLVISRMLSPSMPDMDSNWSIIRATARGASVRPMLFITAAVCAIALRASRASLTESDRNRNAPAVAPIAAVTAATTPTALPQPAANFCDVVCVLPTERFTPSNERSIFFAPAVASVVSSLISDLAFDAARPNSMCLSRLRSSSRRVSSYSFCRPCSPRSIRSANDVASRPRRLISARVCFSCPLISSLAASTIWRRSAATSRLLRRGSGHAVGVLQQGEQHGYLAGGSVEELERGTLERQAEPGGGGNDPVPVES